MRSGVAKILIAVALAGGVAITAGNASATTVCLGGDLGSGLIDQSQKATAAAMQIADK
jgi:hypothetical protein